MPKLIIVESPAKARTIKKILGDDYEVKASMGHIRDLPDGTKGIDLEQDFAPTYIPIKGKNKVLKDIRTATKNVDEILLAMDGDREGESIAWHLFDELKPEVPVRRMVFREITKSAIETALGNTRELDMNLVEAQRARRTIDRLYGWDVSPILWRKIKPKLSAGRVQSVALRLLVEREDERIAFESTSFHDLKAKFSVTENGSKSDAFDATLVRVEDQNIASLRDFDATTGKRKNTKSWALTKEEAQNLLDRIKDKSGEILKVEVKPQVLRPSPPFTTSTMQQEAVRRLRFSARRTMQIAQRLYEAGYITYMRTDSTTLSDQAIQAARNLISNEFGSELLPPAPRAYVTKTRNAQEAHEAIRPAGEVFPSIADMKRTLDTDEYRLYELIWRRTVASQMVDSHVDQTTLQIGVDNTVFRASGRTVRVPGYTLAYKTLSKDDDSPTPQRTLPNVVTGTPVVWADGEALELREQNTRPPARFNDASLVKTLEEKGIGRPSTYAQIIQNLLDKGYCFRRSGRMIVPTFMGIAVVHLLKEFMPHLVDYNFTADMESQLDSIARGEYDPTLYLSQFYNDGFGKDKDGSSVPGLVDLLNQVRDEIDPRKACTIAIGENDAGDVVQVRIGRYGPFVQVGDATSPIPDDQAPDELTLEVVAELIAARERGETPLGHDDKEHPVYLRNGRFGWYVELGDDEAEKPKRVSLSEGMDPEAIDLETAIRQLSLPKTLGVYPSTDEEITANVGRYGDYVRSGKQTRSLKNIAFAIDVTLEQAIKALDEQVRKKEGVVLGKDPTTDAEVRLMDGRYGPYLTNGELNASIPKNQTTEDITLEFALNYLKEKGKAPKRRGRKKQAKQA